MAVTPARVVLGKTAAWYRFTETAGKTYGPRTVTWILRAYGERDTCEISFDENGIPASAWTPSRELAERVVIPLITPSQRKKLQELGEATIPVDATKPWAAARIVELEELQPPSAEEVEEARASGIDTAGVSTRRELMLAWDAVEEADDAQAELEALQPQRRDLVRRGAIAPEQADEDALNAIGDAVESFECARDEAREWGVSVSAIPKPRQWSQSEFEKATAALEQFTSHAPTLTADVVTHALGREREPSQAVMRLALTALYLRFAQDAEAWQHDPTEWFVARVAVEEEQRRVKRSVDTEGRKAAPRPARAARHSAREQTESNRPLIFIAIAIALIAIALAMAAG